MIGAVAAVTLSAVAGVLLAPSLVVGIIVGAALFGLPALYTRLPNNPDVFDADTGGMSVVEVATGELDAETVDQVRETLHRA